MSERTKEVRNVAAELLPKRWEEIYGHTRAKRTMQKWIERNTPPYFLFLTGASGVGKNSLVNTYIKAVLCEDRQEGYNPCGRCTTCRQDIRTMGAEMNVIWVKVLTP